MVVEMVEIFKVDLNINFLKIQFYFDNKIVLSYINIYIKCYYNYWLIVRNVLYDYVNFCSEI